MNAVETIKALVDKPDPYRNAPADLRTLQLEAARERFAHKREKIKVLDRRAREAGIDEINSFSDLVPLLFSHTNYKGYPESFVDNGQWSNMNLWLQTMTSRSLTGVDLEGVRDADDWLARLEASGHYVYASSGTSGKCSFLDQTHEDVDLAQKSFNVGFIAAWEPLKPANDRITFTSMPATGAHRYCAIGARFLKEHIASPGNLYFLSDEPLRANQGIRAGQLRRKLAAGTALPDEVAAFEAETAAQAKKMQAAMEAFIDKIYECRHQPLCFSTQWPQTFQIVEGLRARGMKDGDIHPDTMVETGGGLKGVTLPADFREQIEKFFGLPREHYAITYGMVEMTGLCPYRYDQEGYAFPPWIVPLVLDKSAEKLLNPEDNRGVVEGRLGLFDLISEAHWGGVISGDKVTADFSPGDNLIGPLIRSVSRYQDLEEGEDKLSCAGTIDSYVRGELNL